MDIRQLRYLIALARERHFSRAAAACAVTQPTLSARIRQLEEDLGVPIVLRGNRYHGLTPEGEKVLKWARRIVEDWDGLREDVSQSADSPEGRLVLGAIPSALPMTAPLASALRARWPRVRFTVLSRASVRIAQELENFDLDAGLTYLDEPLPERGVIRPLYRERYRLFAHRDHPLSGRETLTWAEAAEHPLVALTADMRNRRIVDQAFEMAGVSPRPEAESNSMLSLCAFVRTGRFAAVLPEAFESLLGGEAGLTSAPLTGPEVSRVVGVAALEREPPSILVQALMEAAESLAEPGLPSAEPDLSESLRQGRPASAKAPGKAPANDPDNAPAIEAADDGIETGDLISPKRGARMPR